MEAIKVYTQRIIEDLRVANKLFADVELISGKNVLSMNSLILAALSSTLRDAFKDIEHLEENIKVILPEDLDFDLLTKLFDETLFSTCANFVIDEHYMDIMTMLDIKLVPPLSELDNLVKPLGRPGNTRHTCKLCKKSFSLKKLLARHIRTFHCENPNTCEQCGRLCRSQSELSIHMRVHTKERPHQCVHCRRSFTQVSHLNEHVNTVHYGCKNPQESKPKNICETCGAVLSTRTALQRHVKAHNQPKVAPSVPENVEKPVEEETTMEEEAEASNPTLLVCNFEDCGKVLKTYSSFKLHLNTHNTSVKDRRPFSCPTCEKSFTQKSHLTVHMRVHNGLKPHMCSFCGRQFSVRSNMKKHLKMHEKKRRDDEETLLALASGEVVKENVDRSNKVNVCEFCGRACGSFSDLEQHLKTHTEEKPFECPVCLSTFATRSALRIHEKNHTGEEQHICQTCDLACVSQSALEKHWLVHTGEKPFDCPVQCGKSFKQKSQVNYHVKTVHGDVAPRDRPRNHVCLHCSAAFTTASTLRKHARVHTNDRRHQCKFCNKSFIQKVHLQTHLLRHSGDKPWLCNVCGKGFVTNTVLKEHSKLHTGTKKTFPCTDCNATYANLADLTVHKRRHTGELPFTCDKCSKSFRSKRLLQEHERSHLNIKPFACANCGKTFATASGLRQHYKRHDTCKLTSLPGSFSLVDDQHATLLVDFLPTDTQAQSAQDHEDVIMIDSQTFALPAAFHP